MWKWKRKTKEKVYKEYNENKASLIKSSIFVILTLLVTILPFYILPSNVAYAEINRRFKYTFNCGSTVGSNYTYTIITEEKYTGEGGKVGAFSNDQTADVRIVDAYWNNAPQVSLPGDAVADETGLKSLYDYMCAISYQDEQSAQSGAAAMMKKVLYAAVDAGYSFLVNDNTDDAQLDKRYVYKKDSTHFGWGSYKTGALWWKGYETYLDAMGDPDGKREHTVLQWGPDREKLADKIAVTGCEYNGTVSSLFQNDQWICWMITKAIENKTNSGIKACKKEITNGLNADTNGNYRYEILEDTMNRDTGTIDVDVFRTGFNGQEKKIFTFRYTKGAATGKQTPTICYPTYNEKANADDNMQSGYYVEWKGSGFIQVGRLQTWPEVEGGSLVCGIDKRWREVADAPYPYFNNTNCILENLNADEEYNYTHMITAPFVFDETNYCIVGYCAAHCGGDWGEDTNNVTMHQELGMNEFSSAISKCYIGIKIPHSILDKAFPADVEAPSGEQIDDGNWHLTRYKDNKYDVVAWNEPASDDEEQQYLIMQFGKGHFYKLYYDYLVNWTAARTGLYLSCKKRDENWNQKKYSYNWEKNNSTFSTFSQNANQPDTTFKNQYAPMLVASSAGDLTQAEMRESGCSVGKLTDQMIKDIAVAEGYRVYLVFFDSKISSSARRGKDPADEISVDALLTKSNGSPVCFDVTDWLREDYKEEIEKAKPSEIEHNLQGKTIWGGYLTLDELEESQLNFFKMIVRYSKPIIMFLVLLTLVYTAIFSIMHNQDPAKRALVKERLKHITIGIILFSAVVAILFLCKSLMDTSFEKIEESTGATIVNPFEAPKTEYEENWFIDLVVDLIEAIANIVDWLINSIMKAVVGDGIELNDLIFNASVPDDELTLAPYTKDEWSRYMYGYRALEALALALLAIAIIKFAAELIINASDAEKTAQAKQTCLRVGVAMLAIVLGPYAVRLLLTIFNYLIKMVPLRAVDLDKAGEIGDTGIIGAVAHLLFVWMKFKIYLIFVVRKLMITFMLLITPVVFGLWAISDKFRSFNLWIGELVTNVATQFCYALVFFTASLIIYKDESPFVLLIMFLMFIKLADFFKDSLQGLVNKWGGIDETGVATNAINTVKGYAKRGANTAKKVSSSIGGAVIGTADKLDPDKISDGGRRARNVGHVLQGNLWGIESKSSTYDNRQKVLQKKADSENSNYNKANASMNQWAKKVDIQGIREKQQRGEALTPEEQQRLDIANNYDDVLAGNVSVEQSKALADLNPDNDMYGELHKLNAARSNRDIWQGAADDAKSNVRKVKGTDSWEKKSQPTEKQESMVKQTNESLEKTRDRLAEKTADLKATNAFDGNKDENKMFDQAKNLMEEAKAFNESSMKSNANREINLDSIKETIGETLKQCTSLANKDDYAKLQEFCNTPSEGNSTATTDAFEKKVDARMETLKKSGVIK